MAGKYKAYPEYQDSEVKWLGKVPSSWESLRLKQVLSEPLVYGANEAALNEERSHPRYIRITDMASDGTLRDETFKSLPPSVAKPYMLADGDLLLARSGATVGKTFLYRREFGPCCFAGYLIRARCEITKTHPRLVYWVCQSDYYWQYVSGSQIQATIQNVSAEKYGDLYLTLPTPLPEQIQIARFLDHETGKIDLLIEKQQELIALLKEKRQAVISHAVTKGLNPQAPLKDSGIEWLGQVPEHWVTSHPKYFTSKIVDGVHFKPNYLDEGIPFVTVRNLTAGVGISFENLNYVSHHDHAVFYKRANPQRGDVLLTKDGATLGVARVIETDKVFSIFVSVALIKPIHEIVNAEFLCCALESSAIFNQFKAGEMGSAIKHIHLTDLRNIFVALPPICEQREIANSLKLRIQKLGKLISRAESQITLLQERRTALISAAVTGKIDVRDWEPSS